MKRIASIILLIIAAACSSQPKQEQNSQTPLVQKQGLITKYYAELGIENLTNINKYNSIRLNLKGVNGSNAFRVYLGTESPNLGLSDPFNEIHYVASVSLYPIGVKDSNFTLDVKPTLLDLIQEGASLTGKIPIVLEPFVTRPTDALTPITVNAVEFEVIK